MWLAHDTVAVLGLIFYIPAFSLALYVCIKQFISNKNPSTGLLQAVLILDSVGISPLLLATLGVLSRFVDFVNTRATPIFTVRHFRIVQFILTLGVVLSIAGGTSITLSADGSYKSATSSKVGVLLYIVGFAATIIISLVSVPRRSVVPGKERHVPVVIFLAIPFIVVRLLYFVLSAFGHNRLFSIATGSVSVTIGMSVIEEFVVVGMYILLGLWLEKVHDGPTNAMIGG